MGELNDKTITNGVGDDVIRVSFLCSKIAR